MITTCSMLFVPGEAKAQVTNEVACLAVAQGIVLKGIQQNSSNARIIEVLNYFSTEKPECKPTVDAFIANTFSY